MSLSARGGDTTPGGNAALRGRLDPATSMPRPAAHAGAWPQSGDTSLATQLVTKDRQTAWDTFPICILGSGPGEPSSGLCRALLHHAMHVPGVYEDPEAGGAMLAYDSYFNYIFTLIVGRLAIIVITALHVLFF